MAPTQVDSVADSEKAIVWLDIDNTLYPSSIRVNELMGKRIHDYFVSLGLDEDEAHRLHMKYYTEYGLALRGLTRHHNIDPLDFDAQCDGSLPLEDILKPDPAVRKLLEDFDRSKTRVWALTNAYSLHADRVLRILKLDDLIEGIVFCDYAQPGFTCKPEPEYYHEALIKANVSSPSKCYFVDDNLKNVRAAQALGWASAVYYREIDPAVHPPSNNNSGATTPMGGVQGVDITIGSLEELRTVWSHLFKNRTDKVQ